MMETKLTPPREAANRLWAPTLLELEKPCTTPTRLFPPNYAEARERFLESAERMGCHTESWAVPHRCPVGGALAVDLARWGPADSKNWLLVTTGLHGTEAPFGSAIQY